MNKTKSEDDSSRAGMLALICTVIAVMVFSLFSACTVHASAASNGKLMHKYLKAYKDRDYKQARQLVKKMPKYACEPCAKKMSKARKKAYRKVVKHYVKKYGTSDSGSGKCVVGYYLSDLDGDNDAELLIKVGSCEADYRADVYEYLGHGKTRRFIKKHAISAGHSVFCAYPGHAGVVLAYMHKGHEKVSKYVLKNGRLKCIKYGHRTNSSYKTVPKMCLRSHIHNDEDCDDDCDDDHHDHISC